MSDLKRSDFVPEPDKSFSEAFPLDGGCPKCGKGYRIQYEHKDYPDCSNVLCDWNMNKQRN